MSEKIDPDDIKDPDLRKLAELLTAEIRHLHREVAAQTRVLGELALIGDAAAADKVRRAHKAAQAPPWPFPEWEYHPTAADREPAEWPHKR